MLHIVYRAKCYLSYITTSVIYRVSRQVLHIVYRDKCYISHIATRCCVIACSSLHYSLHYLSLVTYQSLIVPSYCLLLAAYFWLIVAPQVCGAVACGLLSLSFLWSEVSVAPWARTRFASPQVVGNRSEPLETVAAVMWAEHCYVRHAVGASVSRVAADSC